MHVQKIIPPGVDDQVEHLNNLPIATKLKIQQEYKRVARSHPNMTNERIMKLVGRRLDIKFSYE